MADLFELTQQAIAGFDVELVDVERASRGLLRVTIDSTEGISIDDCEQVSRHLSRVYEVEDIDYQRLEVGSPGVDRPLRTPEDFLRFANERVTIRLREPLENRKVFTGILRAPQEHTDFTNLENPPTFCLDYQDDSGNEFSLNFIFDDVDRANLDPVLDFKGKKR